MKIILVIDTETGNIEKLSSSSLSTLESMKNIRKLEDNQISVINIFEMCGELFKINPNKLIEGKRDSDIYSRVRFCLFHILHNTYNITNLSDVTRLFNKKSHANIIYGIGIVEDEIKKEGNNIFKIYYSSIMLELKERGWINKNLVIN